MCDLRILAEPRIQTCVRLSEHPHLRQALHLRVHLPRRGVVELPEVRVPSAAAGRARARRAAGAAGAVGTRSRGLGILLFERPQLKDKEAARRLRVVVLTTMALHCFLPAWGQGK